MLRYPLFCILYLLVLSAAEAQFDLQADYPAVTGQEGTLLPHAWLGGLNAPQWNAADLDGDGTTDLLIFDRAGDALLALRGDGQGGYAIAPELTAGFPDDLVSWVLLRDYNDDGNADLMTYSAEFDGLRIFRGERDAAGLLEFPDEPAYAGLRYPLGDDTAPIFITSIDYPAFDDIDGDGDLDILTFSVNGGFLEYYRNESVERGFGSDTLIYTLEDECWGGFYESGQTPALDLADAPGNCVRNAREEVVEPRHAGSTILSLDIDGNGLKDIMLGDVSFEVLVLGLNTGSDEEAYISDQDPSWNSNGTTVNIPFFPAAYHLDIDQDGRRDLVASPNQILNAADLDVAWYYRNEGTDATPDFVFREERLLVGESIDYGTGGIPAVFDYDADGRPDLIVGNNEAYSNDFSINSQLRLFRNVTPPGGAVAFAFADDDFLELSQFQSTTSAFSPAFGDLDGDGDQDAVVGERGGGLIFLENTAGADRPATFAAPVFDYMGIDVVQLSRPAIADLDRDGLNDLVVGGFDGRIRFYRNIGSADAPDFNPDPTAPGNSLQLGGVNTNVPGFSTGHPTPLLLTYDDRFVLITGNRAGTIEAYGFTDYTAPFTLLSERVADIDLGGFTNPATGDFDGDGLLELVIGNQRGGVTYYRSDLVADNSVGLFSPVVQDFFFTLFPNPAAEQLTLRALPGTQVQWLEVNSSAGRLVYRGAIGGLTEYFFDLGDLVSGIYFITVVANGRRGSRRVVIE